jgi:murein DD-endopeptidase MepM/ murein hydrolase activator NlpD
LRQKTKVWKKTSKNIMRIKFNFILKIIVLLSITNFPIYSTYAVEKNQKKEYMKELENIEALILKDKQKIKILDQKLQGISNHINNIKNNIVYNDQKVNEYYSKKSLLNKNLYKIENLIKNAEISKKEYGHVLDKLLLLTYINKEFSYEINAKKKIILDYLLYENINSHNKLNKIIFISLEELFLVQKAIKNINEHIKNITKKTTTKDLLVINTASEAITISKKRALVNIINNHEGQRDKITKILSLLEKNYTQKPLEKIVWNNFYKNNLTFKFKNLKRPEGIIYEFKIETVIIAPVSGKIVFSNYFKGYKNIFIIDPGFGFHVILSGLDEIYYKIGKHIKAGENIGVVKINQSNPAELYVEVRLDGKIINPIEWFNKNSKGK